MPTRESTVVRVELFPLAVVESVVMTPGPLSTLVSCGAAELFEVEKSLVAVTRLPLRQTVRMKRSDVRNDRMKRYLS